MQEIRRLALEKLAFHGSAQVIGSPMYYTPPLSVGQVLYHVNSPYNPMTNHQKRQLIDSINGTKIDVNKPAKSLLRAGIGALAGNFISTALGAGPFMRGLSTAIGANYGYNN